MSAILLAIVHRPIVKVPVAGLYKEVLLPVPVDQYVCGVGSLMKPILHVVEDPTDADQQEPRCAIHDRLYPGMRHIAFIMHEPQSLGAVTVELIAATLILAGMLRLRSAAPLNPAEALP